MNKEVRESAVRDAKRNLILDAARKLFGEKPFHDVRLEDIAEAAGFSKASLYNYYENKEVIFLSLANREYAKLTEAVEARMREDASLAWNVRAMTTGMLEKIGEHFAVILAFSQLRANALLHLEAMEKMHAELMKEYGLKFSCLSEPLMTLLGKARTLGEFESTLTDEEISDFFGGLFRATMLRWKSDGKMGDIERAVDNITTFFLNGINYLGEE